MSQRCWTCSQTVEDAVAIRCTRPHCNAKHEQAKDQKLAQQRKWAEEEKPDHFDGWQGG